jgi:hypothetical protein
VQNDKDIVREFNTPKILPIIAIMVSKLAARDHERFSSFLGDIRVEYSHALHLVFCLDLKPRRRSVEQKETVTTEQYIKCLQLRSVVLHVQCKENCRERNAEENIWNYQK